MVFFLGALCPATAACESLGRIKSAHVAKSANSRHHSCHVLRRVAAPRPVSCQCVRCSYQVLKLRKQSSAAELVASLALRLLKYTPTAFVVIITGLHSLWHTPIT